MAVEGLVLVLALAAFGFVLSYIAFNLDKRKHFFLQLIIFMFVITVLGTQLPRAAVNYEKECDFVVANESVQGNVTTYSYVHQCVDRTDAPETFAKAGFWFIRVFYLYIFLYLLYEVGRPFISWFRSRRGK